MGIYIFLFCFLVFIHIINLRNKLLRIYNLIKINNLILNKKSIYYDINVGGTYVLKYTIHVKYIFK